MEAPLKTDWIARCIKRLAELRPGLMPGAARHVAERLWQDERGHVPPEEWAEIEVRSWAGQGP